MVGDGRSSIYPLQGSEAHRVPECVLPGIPFTLGAESLLFDGAYAKLSQVVPTVIHFQRQYSIQQILETTGRDSDRSRDHAAQVMLGGTWEDNNVPPRHCLFRKMQRRVGTARLPDSAEQILVIHADSQSTCLPAFAKEPVHDMYVSQFPGSPVATRIHRGSIHMSPLLWDWEYPLTGLALPDLHYIPTAIQTVGSRPVVRRLAAKGHNLRSRLAKGTARRG